MIKKYFLINSLILFGIFVMLISCLDEDFNSISNQQEINPLIALPFIQSTTTLFDLLPEDKYLNIDKDQFINIIFQKDSFAYVNSDSLLDIENQPPTIKSMALGPIELEPYEDDFRMTILQLSQNIEDTVLGSYFPQGVEYSNEHGSAYFPPIVPQSAGYYSRPGPDDFEYILIESGIIEISLHNELPVEITSIDMVLMNMIDSSIIGNFSFNNIPINETAYSELLIENQLLQNDLLMYVNSFHLEGSGSNPFATWTYVPLSYDQGVDVVVSTRNVIVNEGLVRFPEAEGPSDSIIIDLEFENGMELLKMDVLEGDFNYIYESSVKTDIDLQFTIPQLQNNVGEIYNFSFNVTNTENSGPQGSSYSIDGYNFDLSGSQNQLEVHFSSMVIPTPENADHVIFSEYDTVRVTVSLDNIKFSYIEGYFGQVEKFIDEDILNIDMGILQEIGQGITLAAPSLTFISNNTIGIPFEINLNMVGFNNGQSIDLNGPNIQIESDQISTSTFSNNNSQIIDFIGLNPQQMIYSGSVISNPLGNTGMLNHISAGTGLNIGFEMDLPLELRMNNVILTDTLALDNNLFNLPGDTNNSVLNYIKSSSLVFNIENEFPFDADLNIYLKDSISGLYIDSLNIEIIEAAETNEDGKVDQAKLSKFTIELIDSQIESLNISNQAEVKIKLNTNIDDNSYVKLYTNYSLKINIGIINELL